MHTSPVHSTPTRLWVKAAPAPLSLLERLTVQPGHLLLAAAAPGLPVARVAFTGDAHDPARRWTLDRNVRLAATEADLTARDAHTLMFREGETLPCCDTVAAIWGGAMHTVPFTGRVWPGMVIRAYDGERALDLPVIPDLRYWRTVALAEFTLARVLLAGNVTGPEALRRAVLAMPADPAWSPGGSADRRRQEVARTLLESPPPYAGSAARGVLPEHFGHWYAEL